MNQGSYELKEYRDDYYNYGSDIRDEAMIAQVLAILDKNQEALTLLNKLIKRTKSDYYSTQEQSMMLIAIAALSGKSKLGKMDFEYSWNAAKALIQSEKSYMMSNLSQQQSNYFHLKTIQHDRCRLKLFSMVKILW